MKRKEIYVAVIIDTISQNNCGDEAYIFNTKLSHGMKNCMENVIKSIPRGVRGLTRIGGHAS